MNDIIGGFLPVIVGTLLMAALLASCWVLQQAVILLFG